MGRCDFILQNLKALNNILKNQFLVLINTILYLSYHDIKYVKYIVMINP